MCSSWESERFCLAALALALTWKDLKGEDWWRLTRAITSKDDIRAIAIVAINMMVLLIWKLMDWWSCRGHSGIATRSHRQILAVLQPSCAFAPLSLPSQQTTHGKHTWLIFIFIYFIWSCLRNGAVSTSVPSQHLFLISTTSDRCFAVVSRKVDLVPGSFTDARPVARLYIDMFNCRNAPKRLQ